MIAARSNLDAALRYAQQGLPVFPVVERGKQPAIKGGFHAATTNPATVARYWRLAERNVGVATGAISSLWVLDIDGAVGEASLSKLEAKYGPLPATRTVATGGGGRHLWFKYGGPIPSTTGRIAPGLDTRGDAAYIVAPPSTHPNGRPYKFLSYDEPVAAPEWLERLARTRPQSISERALAQVRTPGPRSGASRAYGQAALEREVADLAATLPGTRNTALNRCAFRLYQLVAGGELNGDQVSERLIEASHRNGLVKDDGLRSVIATIRSACAGLKFPRSRSGGA